jgi:hypothetical protein
VTLQIKQDAEMVETVMEVETAMVGEVIVEKNMQEVAVMDTADYL